MDPAGGRVPPHSNEAEVAVLGGMLLENAAIDRVLEVLGADGEEFYREAHRQIFRAALSLYDRNEPVDLLTVTEALKTRDELSQVGGASYVAELPDRALTSANITYYARIVREKAILRRLIVTASEIAAGGYQGQEDVDQFVDQAEHRIFEISERKARQSFAHVGELITDAFQKIEHLYERKELVTGVPSGFVDLDRLTAGFQPSDLIIVAGRPSMGKTSYVLNIAEHVAIENDPKIGVGIFSLEMSKEQLVLRLLCSQARVDLNRLRTGRLSAGDFPELALAAGRIHDAPIYIDDTPAISPLELRAKARRLCRDKDANLGLVVVDYLQLMKGSGDSREQEISNISRSLKALAKEINIPVVALSQLNRQVESRHPPKPRMADLRECVAGDTLVCLEDGRRVPVRDLVDARPNVLALGGDERLTGGVADKVWKVGRRPVFDVVLRTGLSIRATSDHQLFGADGWRRLRDLQVGDRLAIARTLPEPSNADRWPELRVSLLGQLIGDGSYLKGQPLRYTTESEENSRLVERAAVEEFGCVVRRYAGRRNWHQLLISGNGNRWQPAGVGAWLRELNVFDQRSHEKRVPEAAFGLANDQIALLLRHLWATDGTIWPRPKGQRGSNGVFYSTNSEGLARDVMALLRRLGIVARLETVKKGTYRPTRMVIVSGTQAQRRFLDTVGAFGPRCAGAELLREKLATCVAGTNVDTVPREIWGQVQALMKVAGISQRAMTRLRGTSFGGSSHFRFAPSRKTLLTYATILASDELRKRATGDLYWDTIEAITPAGEEDVFDLTVPGPASWIADGIVSHNSGAIEQDADVIAFIYRHEVYFPDERQGEADIILAKQRNGPVGEVTLTFRTEYTRFENFSGEPEPFFGEGEREG